MNNNTRIIDVPVWEKYMLTIKEAAKYFGIGEKRLYEFAHDHIDDDFIFVNGKHILIKRKKLEGLLDGVNTI